jgi:ethanolamine ammonia-lyase small subunit
MLSANQISEAIEAEGRRIGQLAEECADISAMSAETEADYKITYARSRMEFRDHVAENGGKVTVAEIDDHATLEASESLRAYLVASGSMTAIREALKASQARLDGLRTLAAGYRQAGG